MRMDSHRGVNPVFPLGHFQSGPQTMGPGPAANRQNGLYAARQRPLENLLTVAVKIGKLQVSMGVGKHQRSRAPLGTSSVKVARIGRSSLPTDAATIMPFDSMPRNLRGMRLAMMTTFLPSKSSGA